MPELPEVETVRTGLEAALKHAHIRTVTLRRANLRIPFPDGFAAMVENTHILGVERRAKYLLFRLDNGWVIVGHLGMSGRFSVLAEAPERFAAHDHMVWGMADGRCVVFNDARRFGLMTLTRADAAEEHPLLAELGPEPLGKAFSAGYLKEALSRRRIAVKVALMDQKLVVGVGNIYASEALYLAKIDPRRPADEVAGHAALLVKCIRKVLKDAIVSGGSSLRDFVDISGETGYFQHHFNVYGRAGKPCISCGTPIVALRQAGRSTFFCPQCQS
jgi:formamidopyrimidine-DNA glycosylase